MRYDPNKYPYLLLGTKKDWLECVGSPTEELMKPIPFPCLRAKAEVPAVASLAEQHVMNVFVSGSQIPPFCTENDAETACGDTYAGYVGSAGPWFAKPSDTWTEDAVTENWMYINYDQFDPAVKNNASKWDGGAVTFAHEVGHYVGLMHTHEGGCAGGELTAADAVPDTPLNENTAAWAGDKLMFDLVKWCSFFRNGKQPDPRILLQFNSCESPNGVDNVFNLLSYLPDSCCMLLTTNQIARMQWAIAKFRPKMMAKYAIK